MKFKINKQTEKAINISFNVIIEEEILQFKSAWFPKSQFDTIKINGEIVDLDLNKKNSWLFYNAITDYCKYVKEMGWNLKGNLSGFLTGGIMKPDFSIVEVL